MANLPSSPSSSQDPRLSGIMASVQESAAALGYVVEQVVVRPATLPQQQQQPFQSSQSQQQQQQQQQDFPSQQSQQPFLQQSAPSPSAQDPFRSLQTSSNASSIAITPSVQQKPFGSSSQVDSSQQGQQSSGILPPLHEGQQHSPTTSHMSHLLHPQHPSEYHYRQVNHLDLQIPPVPGQPALTSPVSPAGANTSPAGSATGFEGIANSAAFMASGKREIGGAYIDAEAAVLGTPEVKRSRVAPDLAGFSLGPPEGTRHRGNRFAPAMGPKRSTIDGSLIRRLRGFSSASGRLQGMPPSPKGDESPAPQLSLQQQIGEVNEPLGPQRTIDAAAPLPFAGEGRYNKLSTSSIISSPSSPMDIIEGNKERVVTSAMMAAASPGRARRRGSSSRGGTQHNQQSPERPFGCPRCSTWFGRKDNLKKHIRMIHLNERPFPCELCGYAFQKKDHLHKHIRTVHQRQRPFGCDRCDKTFGQKSDLTKHVRTVHEKQRPYICKVCGMAFGHKGNLMRHIWVVHEKQRPYRCTHCNSEFGEKSNLDKHIRQVHEKRHLSHQYR